MRKIRGLITGFILFITSVKPVFAQSGLGCGGGLGMIGDFLCGIQKGEEAIVGERLNVAISGIIGFLTIVAALWFVIQFIIAGYNWINAGGDKGRTQAAQEKITNAVVGLLIVVSAWVIIAVIGSLVGLDILDPGKVIQNLGI